MSEPQDQPHRDAAGEDEDEHALADGDGDGRAETLRSWQLLARAQRAALARWGRLAALRRFVNLLVPSVIAGVLLFSALPRDTLPDTLHPRHDLLVGAMRKLSLSQRWLMYAPNPTNGHANHEFIAYDEDGSVRVLEESRLVEEGWGSSWAWDRTRRDIWTYSIGRKPNEVNRSRIWFIRGLCLREARRGHLVDHIEIHRVFRRVRPPEELIAGGETLGPIKRRKIETGSCHVKIIRDMVAEDPLATAGGGTP